jgi:hypothetical protein
MSHAKNEYSGAEGEGTNGIENFTFGENIAIDI